MRGRIVKNEGLRGVSYTVIVDVGVDPVTGARKQKKMTLRTKKEAEKWLADTIAEVNQGVYIEPQKQTMGEYLNKWLDTYGRQNLATSTLESYQNIVTNHLVPVLGGVPLQKLLPAHLQEYYAQALQCGRVDNKKGLGRALSATTVLYHHRVIREALNHAMKSGILNRNIADMVEPPRKVRGETEYLPEEDVPKLLNLFKDKYLYMPVYLGIMTGARAGEILALRWKDIDLARGVINLSQSLRQRKTGQPEFQQPKTPRSKRAIEITPLVVKVLKEHRVTQGKNRLAHGEGYAEYNLVCCLQNGQPIHPGTLASRYYKITRKAGINVKFHGLRHSHATYLLQAGVSPKVVAERLGHSTTRLTLDTYSHVVPGMQREAAIRLEERLFGKQNG